LGDDLNDMCVLYNKAPIFLVSIILVHHLFHFIKK
jgi:hypothetical protein